MRANGTLTLAKARNKMGTAFVFSFRPKGTNVKVPDMYTVQDAYEVLRTSGRLLVFRLAAPDLTRHGPLYLAIGMFFTWLAGVGRHWDNPRAGLWQHLGLGSVAYVLVFALLLWLVLSPLKPANWHYRNVLIFVALTAPPAFLYALPGRFLAADAIPQAKVLLLALVAVWRVALLGRYLWGSAGLRGGRLFVAMCFPLALLVTALVVLNLDHVVFDLMGGGPKSPNDEAYAVLLLIDFVAVIAMPVLLIMYVWHWNRASKQMAASE